MRMYDLIMKKRNGEALSAEEIRYLIKEYVDEKIPDYQMAAFLMAVYFKGMTEEETLAMTLEAARSGDMVDLSKIKGIKVDKHSTGGVGDKTTLIVAPMVAACGVKVAKMSGRGLGHTGGTIDKLESIPGFQTALTQDQFFEIVNTKGLSVVGQTGNLVPADKKLYALRDVTATVDSIPLIAVSIMSKKLAAGSDGIVLDVKMGSGAFMKTEKEAVFLAEEMVKIGENAGRKMVALVTNMDVPLGNYIGNTLELIEAVNTLKGNGPSDLTEISLQLAGNMLYLAGKGSLEECIEMAKNTITSGEALEKLIDMVEAQGGDASVIRDTEKFEKAPYKYEILAKQDGYIIAMDTEACGVASAMLGAGRETKDSRIDHKAGIIINRKTGEYVKKGECLATMYASEKELFAGAAKRYEQAVTIGEDIPEKKKLILARITKEMCETKMS